MPLTLAAKTPDRAMGVAYVLPFVTYGAAFFVGACEALTRGAGARRVVAAFGAIAVVVPVLEGGDWMPLQRLLLPALPLLAIAADGVFASALRTLARRDATAKARGLSFAALALVALWVGRNVVAIQEVRTWILLREVTDDVRASLARELTAAGIRSVALFDIGVVGAAAPSMRIVDLGGLTDPMLARTEGGHGDKRPSEAWLVARAPDVVAFNHLSAYVPLSGGREAFEPQMRVEARLLEAPWFRARYGYACTVNVAQVYRLQLFVRAGLHAAMPRRCEPRPSLTWMRTPSRMP